MLLGRVKPSESHSTISSDLGWWIATGIIYSNSNRAEDYTTVLNPKAYARHKQRSNPKLNIATLSTQIFGIMRFTVDSNVRGSASIDGSKLQP